MVGSPAFVRDWRLVIPSTKHKIPVPEYVRPPAQLTPKHGSQCDARPDSALRVAALRPILRRVPENKPAGARRRSHRDRIPAGTSSVYFGRRPRVTRTPATPSPHPKAHPHLEIDIPQCRLRPHIGCRFAARSGMQTIWSRVYLQAPTASRT